jgi:uncharacterized Zn-finger protein
MITKNFIPGWQVDSNDVICPHCGETMEGYGVFEGLNEGVEEVHECSACGKKFRAWFECSIDYITDVLGDE